MISTIKSGVKNHIEWQAIDDWILPGATIDNRKKDTLLILTYVPHLEIVSLTRFCME